jgi:hypothetical protein
VSKGCFQKGEDSSEISKIDQSPWNPNYKLRNQKAVEPEVRLV